MLKCPGGGGVLPLLSVSVSAALHRFPEKVLFALPSLVLSYGPKTKSKEPKHHVSVPTKTGTFSITLAPSLPFTVFT